MRLMKNDEISGMLDKFNNRMIFIIFLMVICIFPMFSEPSATIGDIKVVENDGKTLTIEIYDLEINGLKDGEMSLLFGMEQNDKVIKNCNKKTNNIPVRYDSSVWEGKVWTVNYNVEDIINSGGDLSKKFIGYLFVINISNDKAFSLKEIDFEIPDITAKDKPYLRINTKMHTAMVRRISIDANGKYLLSCSDDKTAILWDAVTGEYIRTFRIPIGDNQEGKLYSCAISPNSMYAVMGGWTGYQWDDVGSLYIFNASSGEIIKRVSGFPNVIFDIEFNKDGKYLAANLGSGGVFIIQTSDWSIYKKLTGYGADSYNSSFSNKGALATVCDDGKVRLYDRNFNPVKEIETTGGKKPSDIAFSPDGSKIAVGYYDSNRVQILDANNLSLLYEADNTGVTDDENMSSVCWSKNGDYLYVGGGYQLKKDGNWRRQLRIWSDGGKGGYEDINGSENTIMDIKVLSRGVKGEDVNESIIIGGGQPDIMRTDRNGKEFFYNRGETLGFENGQFKYLKINGNGSIASFKPYNDNTYTFNIADKSLLQSDSNGELSVTESGNIFVTDWKNTYSPKLNGNYPEFLRTNEINRSTAVSHNEQFVVFGTDWDIYCLDSDGKQLWEKPVPGAAWAVNISGDDKLVVATLGDGTIRWYNAADGRELVALYINSSSKKWVMWTPEGYFDHSPGGETLVGYQINRDYDKEALFLTIDKFYDLFYRPDLIESKMKGEDISEFAKNINIEKILKEDSFPPEVEFVTESGKTDSKNIDIEFNVFDIGGGVGKIILFYDGMALKLSEGTRGMKLKNGDNPQIKALKKYTYINPITLKPGKNTLEIIAYNKNNTIESRKTAIEIEYTGKIVSKPNLHVLTVAVDKYNDKYFPKLSNAVSDADAIREVFLKNKGNFYNKVTTYKLSDTEVTIDGLNKKFDEISKLIKPEDTFLLFMSGHGITNQKDLDYYYIPCDFKHISGDIYDSIIRQGISKDILLTNLSKVMSYQSILLFDTCNSGSYIGESLEKFNKNIKRGIITASSNDQYALEGINNHGVFTFTLLDGLNGKADIGEDGEISLSEICSYIVNRVSTLTYKNFGYKQNPWKYEPKEDFSIY